jgi:hypothetical protein
MKEGKPSKMTNEADVRNTIADIKALGKPPGDSTLEESANGYDQEMLEQEGASDASTKLTPDRMWVFNRGTDDVKVRLHLWNGLVQEFAIKPEQRPGDSSLVKVVEVIGTEERWVARAKNKPFVHEEAAVTAAAPSEDELGARTVPQLQDLLRAGGLQVGGRKEELIQRLLQAHSMAPMKAEASMEPSAKCDGASTEDKLSKEGNEADVRNTIASIRTPAEPPGDSALEESANGYDQEMLEQVRRGQMGAW